MFVGKTIGYSKITNYIFIKEEGMNMSITMEIIYVVE